jgi:hypothetical protein
MQVELDDILVDDDLDVLGDLSVAGRFLGPLDFSAAGLVTFPTAAFNVSLGGTATYVRRGGVYMKIGRLVDFAFNLKVNVLGSGAGSLVSGLPFVEASGLGQDIPVTIGNYAGIASSLYMLKGVIVAGTSTIQLWGAGGATNTLVQPSVFQNNAEIWVSGRYMAAT